MARDAQARAVEARLHRGLLPTGAAALDLELPGRLHLRAGVSRLLADALAVRHGGVRGATVRAARGEVVKVLLVQEAAIDRRELQGVQIQRVAGRRDLRTPLRDRRGGRGRRSRGLDSRACRQSRRVAVNGAHHADDDSHRPRSARVCAGGCRAPPGVGPSGHDLERVRVDRGDPHVHARHHDRFVGPLDVGSTLAEAQVDVRHGNVAPDKVGGGGPDPDHGFAGLRDANVATVEVGV
mmetsp:Transcript_22838/g.72295  ORF Transcript_22838/g.72295 Transcript_22838/m.72295 type:complete len:238 (+) Transcript_22838:225-938(+)